MDFHQYMACVAALVATCMCVLAPSALGRDCPELVGRRSFGGAGAVAVSGDYAYFSSGSALVVADISDPSVPRVVAEMGLPNSANNLVVAGHYAYVATRYGGVRVIDVSIPWEPVEVGVIRVPGGAMGVAVSDSYAYVADLDGALRVIDVSVPSQPVELGFVETPGSSYDVAVSGDYAFVAAGYTGLRVIDVSSPSSPAEVGFVGTPSEAWGVAVAGNHAFVAALRGGLQVIDVSTPSAPTEVGFIDTSNAQDVAVLGNQAFVPASFEGLRVIDVSTPSAPVELGFLDTPGQALRVAVADGYAYVTAAEAGLRVIDVSEPSMPAEVGLIDTPSYATAVTASSGYAYVAESYLEGGSSWTYGLGVFDLSTPSVPIEVGFVATDDMTAVALSGSYVYASTFSPAGLRVIDVSTPSQPVVVGFATTPLYATGVAVWGSYAYVATSFAGLSVIDVSIPWAPTVVGSVDTPTYANDVAAAGGYAYVADHQGGLRVIDVRTPSAPVEVGAIETPGNPMGVAVSGQYAYVADLYGGLRIIDVSTPSAPVEVGFARTPDSARDVVVSGGYAYVAGGVLSVIDVEVPSAPVVVGVSDSPRSAADVAVSNDLVVLASYDDGLFIAGECIGPTADGRESFIPAAALAAGAQGAFFKTDVEINNAGTEVAQVSFQWLPRGVDNSEPIQSDPIELAAGQSLRWENALAELFGLEPDSVGALKLVSSTASVIGMSRTYNVLTGKAAGTFGQGVPAIRSTEMISGTDRRRMIFLGEDSDFRANVGCVNGTNAHQRINIAIFDADGFHLDTRTIDLGPYSNNQINRVLAGWQPINGYVDVWADSDDALYTCYGSMLDNSTSDPTTILPQVPMDYSTFIPAGALTAGLEGSFFRTDVDLNNTGSRDVFYRLLWLPRGADNSYPFSSGEFSLAPGSGVRYANVLEEVFGLEPDQVGALAIEASEVDLLAMSRTYNLPSAKATGTFGQELPGIPADRMISTGVSKRIIFMSENDDVRANVGCVNGVRTEVTVQIDLYDSDGVKLETKYMMLPPYSSRQLNGIFQDHAPVDGYVDLRTYTPDASIYCYGSVLDNVTSDPTTVLPQ